MVELTSREHMLAMVADNPDWSVLDLGCGADGIQLANAYADYEDRTQSYPNNRFVKTDACNTPFEDKEFDFVFAIHLLEHIPNPSDICSELMRIGKRGYIEVPTPFFDNFVLGNSTAGNCDPNRVVDLTDKHSPSDLRQWRPKYIQSINNGENYRFHDLDHMASALGVMNEPLKIKDS